MHAHRSSLYTSEVNFLSDRLLTAILFKRPLAQLSSIRSSCDKCLGPYPDTFAVQTNNYELEGFIRANSGRGTIHCSAA